MAKMIAKAAKGAEFFYKKDSARLVPTSSADKICGILNGLGWGLNDGEVWYVFDCDAYEMAYTSACYRRFTIRKGRVYDGRY